MLKRSDTHKVNPAGLTQPAKSEICAEELRQLNAVPEGKIGDILWLSCASSPTQNVINKCKHMRVAPEYGTTPNHMSPSPTSHIRLAPGGPSLSIMWLTILLRWRCLKRENYLHDSVERNINTFQFQPLQDTRPPGNKAKGIVMMLCPTRRASCRLPNYKLQPSGKVNLKKLKMCFIASMVCICLSSTTVIINVKATHYIT